MSKRILVTRPQAQNASFIKALQEQGHIPLVLPLLAIEIYNENQHLLACNAIKHTIQHLAEYRHLVFISTNAVTAGWMWIDRYWPQLPIDLQWYAIGAATAALLEQHVDTVQHAGSTMNSEGLLALPSLQQLVRQKVLVVRGSGGRDYLKQALEARGAQVDYCEVYQRQTVHYAPGTLAALLHSGVDMLTASSGETLQLLLEQAVNDGIKEYLQKIPIIVPGKRVADLAVAAGFQAVIESVNASVPAMINACHQQ